MVRPAPLAFILRLSLELLLLQVILPALLEQGHTRLWMRGIIRSWCLGVAWCLDLRSYLLGDVPLRVSNAAAHVHVHSHLHDCTF